MVELVDVVKDSKSVWAEPDCFHWVVRNPQRVAFHAMPGKLSVFETAWPPKGAPAKPAKAKKRVEVAPVPAGPVWPKPGDAVKTVLGMLSDGRAVEIARKLVPNGHPASGSAAREVVAREFSRKLWTVEDELTLEEVNGMIARLGGKQKKNLEKAWPELNQWLEVFPADALDDEAERVLETGLKREPGYVYFIDNRGDVCRQVRTPEIDAILNGDLDKEIDHSSAEVTKKTGIKREEGFLYFLTEDMVVYRTEYDEEEDEDDEDVDDEE